MSKPSILHFVLVFMLLLLLVMFFNASSCTCPMESKHISEVVKDKFFRGGLKSTDKTDIHVTTRHLNCDGAKSLMTNYSRLYWDQPLNSPWQYGCKVIETLDWALSLRSKEKRVYSQNGEDGVLEEIFNKIGERSRFFVEFGVQDGKICNTRFFREKGWKGVMFDNENNNPTIGLYQASVWIDNVVQLFQSKNVPMVFDLLSVDTDFSDFWNLRAIMLGGYRPRVVIVEVNVASGPYSSFTVPLKAAEDHGMWSKNRFYGASVFAYAKLMHKFGYQLLHVEKSVINAIFLKNDEINNIDLARVFWQRKQFEGLDGRNAHPPDRDNNAFVHICANMPCDSSDDF